MSVQRKTGTRSDEDSLQTFQPDEPDVPQTLEDYSETPAFKEWLKICDAVWKKNRAKMKQDRSR